MWAELIETSTAQASDSLLSTFSNESFGLTANVRKSGDVFEVIVVDAISGEEVLSTHRPTQEEAEKFAFGLMNPRMIRAPSACGPGCSGRNPDEVEPWVRAIQRGGYKPLISRNLERLRCREASSSDQDRRAVLVFGIPSFLPLFFWPTIFLQPLK
jgi:hypothetical protein